MRTFNNLLNLSCVATDTIEAYGLVGFDNAPVLADDKPVKGIALSPANKGEAFSCIALGSCQLKADGAIQAGAKVVSAASGGVKGAASGNHIGVALHDAADGGLVEILIR